MYIFNIYTTYMIDTTVLYIKDTNNIFIDLCQVVQNKIQGDKIKPTSKLIPLLGFYEYARRDSTVHILNFSKVISSVTTAKSLPLPPAILVNNSLARFYSINCLARV